MQSERNLFEERGEELRSFWLKREMTIEEVFQDCKEMLAYGFANSINLWNEEIYDWQRAYAYAFEGLRHGA